MRSINKLRLLQDKLPLLGALGAGFFLLSVAMLSAGYDWSISEIQAELHYSALMDFRQIPIFSYFMNGGSYLFQDPQNTLLSPTTLFILLFGPHAGIRWIMAGWGIIGFLGMYQWLKLHLATSAAWLGALLWVLNLAIIWRIVVGNDMFMLNLGLPWFLLWIEKIVRQSGWKYSLMLGMLGGVYLLGPSFHTLFYLILPSCAIWLLVLLVTKMQWNWSAIWRVTLGLGMACLVTIAIAFPKLYAMRQFEFDRLLCAENSILQPDAWKSLFDQAATFDYYHMVSPFDTDRCAVQIYGTWESNIALFWVAYLLVAVGIVGLIWFKRHTSLHLFVLLLMGAGWLLATWPRFWYFLTVYVSEGVRVSSRYLILINLAFVLLAALGWQLVDQQIKQRAKYWILTALVVAYVFQGVLWLYTARTEPSDYYGKIEPILLGEPVWFDHQAKIDRDSILLAKDRFTPYAISHGQVIIDGYFIAGNDTPIEGSSVVFAETNEMVLPVSPTLLADRLQVTHRWIKVLQLQPQESAVINLLPGQLGQSIQVTPELPLEVSKDKFTMIVSNLSDHVIEEITITPTSPVPLWVWVSWIAALVVGSTSLLLGLWYNHRHAHRS